MNYAEDSIEEGDESGEDSWSSSSSSEFVVPGQKNKRKITLDDQEEEKGESLEEKKEYGKSQLDVILTPIAQKFDIEQQD